MRKLDLLQLASARVTQLRTGSPQIMWGKVIELKATRTVSNGVPNDALSDPATPGRPVTADCRNRNATLMENVHL